MSSWSDDGQIRSFFFFLSFAEINPEPLSLKQKPSKIIAFLIGRFSLCVSTTFLTGRQRKYGITKKDFHTENLNWLMETKSSKIPKLAPAEQKKNILAHKEHCGFHLPYLSLVKVFFIAAVQREKICTDFSQDIKRERAVELMKSQISNEQESISMLLCPSLTSPVRLVELACKLTIRSFGFESTCTDTMWSHRVTCF